MIVSVLKQIKSWTCVNPEQTWTSGYENVTTSAKYFIGRMINEIQILRKAHRLSAVCVCSLEIHFSYLWSHTQTHRHTNIFPHGKVSRIVSSGQQRISQLIQHHTKSLSSLLASPNKLSGETSKQSTLGAAVSETSSQPNNQKHSPIRGSLVKGLNCQPQTCFSQKTNT